METFSFIALCSMWVPVILYVVDYWMWLEPGTGNANYIFFQCLAYNIFLGMILGQFCSACVKRDKAVRLIRKEMQQKIDH
jgi:phosphatidylinositol glycan class U